MMPPCKPPEYDHIIMPGLGCRPASRPSGQSGLPRRPRPDSGSGSLTESASLRLSHLKLRLGCLAPPAGTQPGPGIGPMEPAAAASATACRSGGWQLEASLAESEPGPGSDS